VFWGFFFLVFSFLVWGVGWVVVLGGFVGCWGFLLVVVFFVVFFFFFFWVVGGWGGFGGVVGWWVVVLRILRFRIAEMVVF